MSTYYDGQEQTLYAVETEQEDCSWAVFEIGELDKLERLDEMARKLAARAGDNCLRRPCSTRVVEFKVSKIVHEYRRREV